MARIMNHLLLNERQDLNNTKPDRFPSCQFKVKINRVGEIKISVKAPVTETSINSKPDPSNEGTETRKYIHEFKYVLLTPDGEDFTKSEITLKDLDRYRDLRGFVRDWTLKVSGVTLSQQNPNPNSLFFRRDFSGPQLARITVRETLASSAPPLFTAKVPLNPARDFEFDLYRLGKLRAGIIAHAGQNTAVKVSLITPDGEAIKTSNNGRLTMAITPSQLRLSRGPDGEVRKWKLRFEAANNNPYTISAQVYEKLRIPKEVLLDRLHALLGVNGEKIVIAADWKENKETNQITLTLKDGRLAETLGIHGVLTYLDPRLNAGQDLDEPEVDIPYVLFEDPFVLREGFFSAQVKLNNLKIEQIKIEMASSVERRALVQMAAILLPAGDVLLPKDLPSFILTLTTSGSIPVKLGNWDNAELVIPGFRLEIGLEVADNDRLAARCWVDPESVKLGGKEGSPHIPGFDEEDALKLGLDGFAKNPTGLTDFFENMFDRLMGGAFRFTASRWADDAMEFDYIAGIEQERKPNIGYVARGDFEKMGPGGPVSNPFKKNTWVSPNLSKIDHIVVLMMENRSFDHVLGYLSLEDNQIPPKVDGLTKDIITEFSTNGNVIRALSGAGFPESAPGFRTKLPLGVGHQVPHVIQQLAFKNGEATMTGFAANFHDLHGVKRGPDGLTDFERKDCMAQDVLGYYTDADLPMYGFLAKEFAICDRYFCSHPGPTLPNRMFSLIGDFQRDRNGEPRIHNSLDATFFLSRDQTIFDLLTQRRVSWRVYESFPSVTMLRMFARYAGDDTNIRNIKNLEGDIRNSDLPSVTFIDPAMHDAPANDDHPPADMLHGQELIRSVYRALRTKPADSDKPWIWEKTLFIITYDEHGGLFDHVSPLLAEVLQDPQKVKDDGNVIVQPGGGSGPTYKPDERVIYGVRVPTFLVSPWVEPGFVLKTVLDHTSILKTILIRFCGADRPFLSDRVHHAFDFGAALTLNAPRAIEAKPRDWPGLPDSRSRSKRPMIRRSQLTSEDADWHEFMEVLGNTVKPK